MPTDPERTEQLSEAFVKTCNLGLMRGHEKLTKLPGCWEHHVNDDWEIILNPHSEIHLASDGCEVKPFNILVSHKGMPVGVISPYGGALMMGAEDDFIKALDEQLGGRQ